MKAESSAPVHLGKRTLCYLLFLSSQILLICQGVVVAAALNQFGASRGNAFRDMEVVHGALKDQSGLQSEFRRKLGKEHLLEEIWLESLFRDPTFSLEFGGEVISDIPIDLILAHPVGLDLKPRIVLGLILSRKVGPFEFDESIVAIYLEEQVLVGVQQVLNVGRDLRRLSP